MSTTVIAVVVNLLAFLLPKIGVNVGSEALTNAVQTIIMIASGAWIYLERVKRGDVNFAGVRKY